MLGMLLLAATVNPTAAPSPAPLKTIITVHSSALCSTLGGPVFYLVGGLQANDRVIDGSKPLLLSMGQELVPDNIAADQLDKEEKAIGIGAGGTHNTNPALLMDNQHLYQAVSEIVHNLAAIDAVLNDPTKFPAVAKTDDDKAALQLKAKLQAVADAQRKNLNMLSGLEETFSLQDLIAKGDGTQGTINADFKKPNLYGQGQLSSQDQSVSFQDAVSGPARAANTTPVNPTTDTDPAIKQRPIGLNDNPMTRFYEGVVSNQLATGQVEKDLTQTIVMVANACK